MSRKKKKLLARNGPPNSDTLNTNLCQAARGDHHGNKAISNILRKPREFYKEGADITR